MRNITRAEKLATAVARVRLAGDVSDCSYKPLKDNHLRGHGCFAEAVRVSSERRSTLAVRSDRHIERTALRRHGFGDAPPSCACSETQRKPFDAVSCAASQRLDLAETQRASRDDGITCRARLAATVCEARSGAVLTATKAGTRRGNNFDFFRNLIAMAVRQDAASRFRSCFSRWRRSHRASAVVLPWWVDEATPMTGIPPIHSAGSGSLGAAASSPATPLLGAAGAVIVRLQGRADAPRR
jgi:hypothetical protein